MAFGAYQFSAQDFFNIDDVRRLWDLMRDVARLEGVEVEEPDAALGMMTVPEPRFVNIIEQNLELLAGVEPPSGFLPSKTWLGVGLDEKNLDYSDVNRWFSNLMLLKVRHYQDKGQVANHRVKKTGSFVSGASELRQTVRSG